MSTIEVIILCFINLLSFVIGAKIGMSSIKGKAITINPIKAVKEEIKTNKEMKKENLNTRKIETMLSNIDNYQGNGLGQTQIPKE